MVGQGREAQNQLIDFSKTRGFYDTDITHRTRI